MGINYVVDKERVKNKLTSLITRLAYEFEIKNSLPLIEEVAIETIEKSIINEIKSIVEDMKPRELYFLLEEMGRITPTPKPKKKRTTKKKPVDNQ